MLNTKFMVLDFFMCVWLIIIEYTKVSPFALYIGGLHRPSNWFVMVGRCYSRIEDKRKKLLAN